MVDTYKPETRIKSYTNKYFTLKEFFTSIILLNKSVRFWNDSKIESLRKFNKGDTSEKVLKDISFVLFFYISTGEYSIVEDD